MLLNLCRNRFIILIRVEMYRHPQRAAVRDKRRMAAAFNDRRINRIRTGRESGVRFGHRPMALQLLESCDELGHFLNCARAFHSAACMNHA
ncbi:hypothetical protein D3C84_933140 [compost metagenome]